MSSLSLECAKLSDLELVRQELLSDQTIRDSFPLMDMKILKIYFQYIIMLLSHFPSRTTRMLLYKMKHIKSAIRGDEAFYQPLPLRLVLILYLKVNRIPFRTSIRLSSE